MNRSNLPGWLNQLPVQEDNILISEPRFFAHQEEEYDKQYLNESDLNIGGGVSEIAKLMNADLGGLAMEIGCGTGHLSMGLVVRGDYPLYLITDPSPTFLRISRKKFAFQNVDESRTCYAVLKGEELDRLPEKEFSLIVLRSTLHHVLHIEDFIASAAKRLRPGGIIAFQEPCMEGYVLMGALMQFLPDLTASAGIELSSQQEAKLTEFVETMKFYSRTDVDKTKAEDKHLFRVDELMDLSARYGLSLRFWSNVSFERFAQGTVPSVRDQFTRFFRDYAKFCMQWDARMMELFERFLVPKCAYIEDLSRGDAGGPYMHGVFAAKKDGTTR